MTAGGWPQSAPFSLAKLLNWSRSLGKVAFALTAHSFSDFDKDHDAKRKKCHSPSP